MTNNKTNLGQLSNPKLTAFFKAIKAYKGKDLAGFLNTLDVDTTGDPKATYGSYVMGYLNDAIAGHGVEKIYQSEIIRDGKSQYSLYIVIAEVHNYQYETIIYDVHTNKLLITSLASYLNSLAINQLLR